MSVCDLVCAYVLRNVWLGSSSRVNRLSIALHPCLQVWVLETQTLNFRECVLIDYAGNCLVPTLRAAYMHTMCQVCTVTHLSACVSFFCRVRIHGALL